jgi:hypothetical protein
MATRRRRSLHTITENKGSSTDPNARATAARELRPRSGVVRARDGVEASASAKLMLKNPLVSSVGATLVKPLGDDTWESVGPRLRDLQGCMHRLLNYGVRAAAMSEEQHAQALNASARAGVKRAIADEKTYWSERLGRRFEGANHDPGKAERLAGLSLPSAIEDYVATRSVKAYTDARKHMARGDKSLPSFNNRAPIFLRDGENAWELRRGAVGGYELGLKLLPGRSGKVWFILGVDGASQHAHLRRMLSGDAGVKLGDAKIVRNRRGKWEVRLCYTRPAPDRASGSNVIAVHRGMHQMLTIASNTGQVASLPGEAFLRAKLGFSARRRSLSQHIRKGELGDGARGRGRQRRYQALTRLDDAEARMMRSACQQAAAFVVECASGSRPGAHRPRAGWDASVVYIEDYQTVADESDRRFMPRWPWAQLKSALEWACRKAGIEMRETSSAYIAITCPACRHVDANNVNGRTFECLACGAGPKSMIANVDTVAAFNMLWDAGFGDEPRKRFEKRMREFVQSIKEAAAE